MTSTCRASILVLAASVVLVAARAGEPIALPEEGLVVDAPAGYRSEPAPGSSATVVLLRGGGEPPAELRVIAATLSARITEGQAFDLAKSQFDRATSEVVEKPSGRFLRIDWDGDKDGKKVRGRQFAALRNRRLYLFTLACGQDAFDKETPALEALVSSARFSPPVPRATPPAPPTPDVAKGEGKPKPPENPRPPEPARPEAPRPEEAPKPEAPKPEAAKPVEAPKPEKPAEPEPTRPAPETPKPETPKPETPKPEAPRPETPKPEAPRPETPKPDTADGGGTAAVGSAQARRRVGSENLLGSKASFVSVSSEYDPDVWAGLHVVDGTSTRGWCSAPGAALPHRFVLALSRTADLGRLSFDDRCADLGEDAGAKELSIEVSTVGPQEGYREVLRTTLARGKNGQEVDVPAGPRARWLRVTIHSNHGHPTLTELMEVRAFGLEAAPEQQPVKEEATLRIERLRLSHAKSGEAAVPARFAPGERVWIKWTPAGLKLSPERGEVSLEVDLVIEGQDGTALVARPKVVEHVGRLPRPPLVPYVSVYVDLPKDFPAGDYVARIVARDRLATTEATSRTSFSVAPGGQ